MENSDSFVHLFEKYRNNSCSPAEVKLLLGYFRKDSAEQDQLMDLVLEHLQEQSSQHQIESQHINSILDQAYLNIEQEISRSHPNKTKLNWELWTKILTAAVISIIVAISYLYIFNNKESQVPHALNAQHILAGGKKAVLTLPDGRTVNLSAAQSGIIVKDHTVTYKDGAAIPEIIKEGLMSITTPKGGEYQIVLSDGTKVWLNAGTTLQYAADLRERGKRKVKLLSGEAYFEVFKDKKHPFIVETPTQQVEVLGTHFNINSYADEGKTVITLEEGSVRVLPSDGKGERNNIILKPGEQSLYANGRFQVREADLQTVLAWRNGLLKFKDAPLKTILSEASRWYNIEVEYKGTPSTELFTGGINRSENLEVLLKVLRLSGIKFKVIEQNDHKKLIVNP